VLLLTLSSPSLADEGRKKVSGKAALGGAFQDFGFRATRRPASWIGNEVTGNLARPLRGIGFSNRVTASLARALRGVGRKGQAGRQLPGSIEKA